MEQKIFEETLKLGSFKEEQRPDHSDAASQIGAAVLITCPAAVDRTLLLDERSFVEICNPHLRASYGTLCVQIGQLFHHSKSLKNT